MNDQMLILSIVMGAINLCFYIITLVPQALWLRKTRNSSGISLWSNIICNIDNIFWLVWTYGYYFNSMLMYEGNTLRMYQISLLLLVFSYTFGCILAAYLMVIKINHLIKAKAYKVTEIQLSKILLDKDKKKYFVDKKWNYFKRYFFPILFILVDLAICGIIFWALYTFAYIKPDGSQEWLWVIVISLICAVIWEITCWPQLIKSIRQKDTTGLSFFWCIFSAISCIVNFTYDLSLSISSTKFNYDMIFPLIFSGMIPGIGIAVIKIINVTKAKKLGMTELEYTKKVLIPLVAKKKADKAKKKSLHK